MSFITSRKNLPNENGEMVGILWFNMWKYQLFPYKELKKGDLLYFYESQTKSIVWKTKVIDAYRFPYNKKDAVKNRLKKKFGEFDDKQSYFVTRPSKGFCLAYKVKPIKKLELPKPKGIKFPRQGWLRVNKKIALQWLTIKIDDNSTLDVIVPNRTPIDILNQLNKKMAEYSPAQIKRIVSQIIRGDTELIKALKELCKFRCQFPGCNARIQKKEGGYYIEVAHIEPVSQGGKSVLGNLIVLCPNHHKEFDYGDLEIIEQTTNYLRGKLNGKEFEISFPSN